jgi:hypothetical protein
MNALIRRCKYSICAYQSKQNWWNDGQKSTRDYNKWHSVIIKSLHEMTSHHQHHHQNYTNPRKINVLQLKNKQSRKAFWQRKDVLVSLDLSHEGVSQKKDISLQIFGWPIPVILSSNHTVALCCIQGTYQMGKFRGVCGWRYGRQIALRSRPMLPRDFA